MSGPAIAGDIEVREAGDFVEVWDCSTWSVDFPSSARLAVAAAVAGSGYVLLERGRVERLVAVEAAAREYAESRRSWEALLPVATESGVPVDEWDAAQRRQDAARATLISLFATPDPPNAKPAEPAGRDPLPDSA